MIVAFAAVQCAGKCYGPDADRTCFDSCQTAVTIEAWAFATV